MDFWNDIAHKINRAAETASREIDHLSAAAKKRYRLSVLRGELSDAFERLGRLHYDEFRIADFDGTKEAVALCAAIDSLKEQITALEAQLGDKKTADRVCPKCGFVPGEGMQFCPRCGSPLDGSREYL